MKPQNLKPPYPKISERRVVVEDRVWYVPLVETNTNTFSFPGWDSETLFGNSNPVHVEYCSGNGDWIAGKAEQYPEINWLAVEMKFTRVQKIWSKLKNRHLNNLVVLCGEGLMATKEYFPGSSVSHVYVNFPDPWPKRRHAKNRIIQGHFIDEVDRILTADGEVTLVTDDPSYSVQMIDTMLSSSSFSSHYPDPHYTTDIHNYGASYFENLWRNEGRYIRFHKFKKQTRSGAACI